MSNQSRVTHPIYRLLPTEIEGFDSLAELALDLRWSWNHATDEVWRQLDPELWAITHNPWVVLQTVSRDQIERGLADPVFRKHVDDLVQTRRQASEGARDSLQDHPGIMCDGPQFRIKLPPHFVGSMIPRPAQIQGQLSQGIEPLNFRRQKAVYGWVTRD